METTHHITHERMQSVNLGFAAHRSRKPVGIEATICNHTTCAASTGHLVHCWQHQTPHIHATWSSGMLPNKTQCGVSMCASFAADIDPFAEHMRGQQLPTSVSRCRKRRITSCPCQRSRASQVQVQVAFRQKTFGDQTRQLQLLLHTTQPRQSPCPS